MICKPKLEKTNTLQMSFHTHLKSRLTGLFFLLVLSSGEAQIFINEWMSKNETILADDQGDFDDWIEIYNAGTEAIDLAGYYFTDTPSEPTLWQIPTNQPELTTVPAEGFLVLWADKDIEDGANHLDFKLSSSGETITIFQDTEAGLITIDEVSYTDQAENVSMGRIIDGQSEIAALPAPSPNASNGEFILPSTYTSSISVSIIDPNDDAEQTTNSMFLDSYHLDMVDVWANQLIGFRFQELSIPKGAIITSAHVQFSVDTEHTGACNLVIQCHDTDDAEAFTLDDQNISLRGRTAEAIDWHPEDWIAEFVADSAQRTPNLAPIVQEVVDREGWEEGNNLAFIFSGSGTRQAVAYEYQPARAAKLFITYENALTPNPINDLYINELSANGSEYLNEEEDYSDWIELYNGSDEAQEIQGLFLSDNENDLLKWSINKSINLGAGEFVIINADDEVEKERGLHANFKLGKNGETVFLSQVINNEIVILDSISYPEIPFKATYGREVDGGENWTLFGLTTPLESNQEGDFYLAPATISPPSGLFVNEVENITLTHEDPSVVLRYTTDGSVPTSNDDIYTGPFTKNENSIIRVKAFKSGHLNNVIPLANYLVDMTHELPILTISTDPDNLYDEETGIYVVGNNGSTFGFCGDETPSNFINDWERPASIALYEPDGMKAFEVNAGIKIAGACSRYNALKSMNVYLRPSQYEDDKIEYQIFPDKERYEFKRLKIRNAGQDFKNSMIRDGTLHNITGEILELDHQAYRPAVVYMNGEYWGIMNMRELYGGNYFEDHFDIDKDDIDLIKNPRLGNEIKSGDDVAFNYLFNFVEFNDLTGPDNYEWVKSKIDIDNFINYWATMVYLSCSDWPANNLMVWRPRETDGKFRWVMIDLDASTSAYGIQGNTSYSYDMLDKVTREGIIGWPNDSKSTLFFRKLLENEEFRNEYIQRSCSIMDIIYNPERTDEIISASAAKVDSEIPDHIDRWIDDLPYLQTYEKWLTRVARLKEFFELRPENWVNILDEHFTLDDTYELTFNYDETTPGDVFVNWNKIKVPFNHTNTYYENIPLTVSVEEHEGYEFLYWLETGETEKEIQFIGTGNETLTPIFEENPILVDIEGPQGICIGEEAELDVVVQNCEGCTYEWNDGFNDASRIVSPFTSTEYSVTITNEAGTLTAETVYTIEVYYPPSVLVNSSDNSCSGEENAVISLQIGGAESYEVLWESGEVGDELTNLPAGLYSATVTNENGCENFIEVEIAEPEALVTTISTSGSICFGSMDGFINVEAEGGTGDISFIWNTGQMTNSISELSAGEYELTITDALECTTIESVQIEEGAEITFEDEVIDNDCFGDEEGSISILKTSGDSPFNFNWSTGDESTAITNIEEGVYTLTLTDANGCTTEEEYTVNSPTQIVTESTLVMPQNGDDGSIDLEVIGGVTPYSFLWSNGSEEQNQFNLASGFYTVTITDLNGCVVEKTFDLSTSAINDLEILTSFEIYPNPNDGVFTVNINFENSVEGELRIINVVGQVLFSQDYSGREWKENLDLIELTSGIYWVQINTELGIKTKKLIVEN